MCQMEERLPGDHAIICFQKNNFKTHNITKDFYGFLVLFWSFCASQEKYKQTKTKKKLLLYSSFQHW